MWMMYAILTFFLWGIADLFYKKGNNENDKYSHGRICYGNSCYYLYDYKQNYT